MYLQIPFLPSSLILPHLILLSTVALALVVFVAWRLGSRVACLLYDDQACGTTRQKEKADSDAAIERQRSDSSIDIQSSATAAAPEGLEAKGR